ncbi:hypothetical protein [Streptomyces sp. NK08204]|uniref:hypothetical protein n=1 Tax=Streptomyces sp. NK08204 TaxID=2873260 RepID=UPI0035A8B980
MHIEKVATKGRGPETRYDRDEFGCTWTDSAPGGLSFAHNGCDARIIPVLRRVTEAFAQRTRGVVRCAH